MEDVWKRQLLLSLVFILFFPPRISAQSKHKKSIYPYLITGKVVSINDGDTITILADKMQNKVLLNEIDTPEKGQPYDKHEKAALSDLIFRLEVDVIVQGKDRYGRFLGDVQLEGVWHPNLFL